MARRKRDEEEETRGGSSSANNKPSLREALKGLREQSAALQQRSQEANFAAQEQIRQQTQEAARGLYSAYARPQAAQPKPAQNLYQRAQEANFQAQETRRQQQQANRNLYQRAQEANLAAQEAQRQQSARMVGAVTAPRPAPGIYQRAMEANFQAQEAQRQRQEQQRGLYQRAMEANFAAQAEQDRAQRDAMQGLYSRALEAGKGAFFKAFNFIPGQLAKKIAMSDEDEMRYTLRNAGYGDKAIDEMIASGLVRPTARYEIAQPDSFIGQLEANYNIGELQQQADILLGQGIITGNQEWINRANEIRERLAAYTEENQTALDHDSGTLGNMLAGDMAQYLPQLKYQEVASLPTQPLALLGKYGEAAAQAFGSGSLSYTTMAGSAYENLTEKGAEAEKAATMAKDEAFISSMIEFGDTFADFAFGPMEGINPFAKIGKGATKKLAGRMAIGFGKWALNVGQEYSEEALQELVSIANERRLAEGGGDGGVSELLGYFFDECRQKYPELFELYKKDALDVFFDIDKMKEKFPDLYAEYQGIKPTEEAERLNQAGRGGAVIGGFMGLFGSVTGAVRSEINRTKTNRAFDALVANTDQEALNSLTNEQLTEAMDSARDLNRTDALEILEAEQARRNGQQGQESGIPAPTERAEEAARALQGGQEGRRDQGIAPYAEEAPGKEKNIRANENGAEGFVNENPGIKNDFAENENAPRERSALDVNLEGVLNNGEQSDYRGQQNGNDTLGTGGEALNNEAGAQRGAVDAGDEVGQRRDRVAHYGVKEEVTPASLGITNGSAAQRVQVLDEATFEAGSPEAQAAQRARQRGLEPVFVRGTMEVGGKQVRGYIQGKRVILQADGKYSADQILQHEEYHDASRRNPQLNRTVREALANNLTEQELGDLVGRYITAYDGVYDFSGMTQAEIEALIEEELFADLYAGIDNSGRETLREDARRGYAQAQTEQGQNAEQERDATGPPEGRASYAGPKAKTANSTTLQQAEQMEKDGRSNEEIRQETGWFRDNGNWTFEINDRDAEYRRSGDARFRQDHPEYAEYQGLMNKLLTGELTEDETNRLQELDSMWSRELGRLSELVERGNGTLDMVLQHSELFDAYPDLRRTRIEFRELGPGENGYYSQQQNKIVLDSSLRNNDSRVKGTLIHEIQHAIQSIEGWPGGASIDYWMNKKNAARGDARDARRDLYEYSYDLMRLEGDYGRGDISSEEYTQRLNSMLEGDSRLKQLYDTYRDAAHFAELVENQSADQLYQNTAGEKQARDAANRRNMTDEERKNTSPDLGDENTVFAEDAGPMADIDITRDYIAYGDLSSERKKTKEAIQRLRDKGQYVNLSYKDLEGLPNAIGGENHKAKSREVFRRILKTFLGKDLELRFDGNSAIVYLSSKGLNHAVVGKYSQFKAATFSKLRRLLRNTEYAFSTKHDTEHRENLKAEDAEWDTFVSIARLDGEELPVIFRIKNSDRDVRGNLYDIIANEDLQYSKEDGSSHDAGQGDLGKSSNYGGTPSSSGSVTETHGNSNPQNEGRASVEVPGDPRRELAKALEEYRAANEANDPDYDYRGQYEKIKALRAQVEAGETAPSSAPDGAPSPQGEGKAGEETPHPSPAAQPGEQGTLGGQTPRENAGRQNDSAGKNPSSAEQSSAPSPQGEGKTGEGYPDSHPERGEIGKDGVRVCKDTGALEEELGEVGKAKLRNDTGEYFARVRGKTDGGVLLTIDRDGKRSISKTFATAEEASAWAASYIDGQTDARTDAELDQNKSEKIPQQTMTEALFSGEQQDEYERQKKNKAAEMSTQALRERMKKTDAEIKALRRLEKTTGLSETQKSHMEDLKQSLEIFNDELESRKGRAKAKKKTVEVKGNKPTRSAAEAKNALMDTFRTAAGQRAELGRQIDQRLEKIAETGRVTEQDRTELMDMLMDAGAVREEAAEELRDVRQWLRGARIYVSEHDRADFGDNWNEFRRRAWAAGIYLTDNMTDRKADSLNAELAETFGESMFPTDGALSDMLSNLVDKAEAGRSQMIPFAQAIENEAAATRTDPQEIYNELSQKLDETLRAFAEKAGIEVDLKNRTASMLATERARMEDRLERQAQRRRESEIREKTLKALRRLEKLRGKAASDVRAQIDEALKDIDTQARSLTMSGIEDLQALQEAYEDAKKKAGYIDEENPGNFLRNPYVEEKLARLSKKHLNDMDIADVIELGRVVASLENTVRTQNQMIGEEFDKTIQETAGEVDRDVKASKGAKPGFWQKWFKEEQLSPRRFLDMLGGWKKGGAMSKLSDGLEKGQTRMLDFQRRASQSFDPFLSKKENRKWLETASGKKATWSTYGVANGLAMDGSGVTGQSIEITPMMKIALYLHSLNEDNLRHIQTGGLVIPNKALYLKGKIQEAYAQGERVKMQPQAVRAIASTLTQQEKTFAGYLQKFFNEQSKAAINEVSLQLDGFERAGVDNYFPIESSKSFLASDVAGEARAQTVEGIGSIANERVHASNPIVLSDATDVLTRQIDKVSRYYGFAIPIRNFQAVNNYVFHEEGNAFAGSIKDTINRKWGAGAENYITKMLQDLQSSGRRSDMMGSALAKLRGNLAGATLMFNPSVAISQAASYPGAAQAVGWDGLAAGLVAGPVDTKLIEKYTPLYWYRNQGNSTQELGDAIKEKGLEQKLPWAMNWIQKMDSFTIRRLWAAAEYRVQKDNPGLKPGSKAEIDAGNDEYYRKVAEVFNRAVYDTQPNYTNMERAQILRSDSDVTKFLTMYKTVPLQYYGMMTEAAGRLQSAMQSGNKAEIAEARRYAMNTFGGVLAANTVYVALKALGKGFRGKDDDYRDEEGNLTAASTGKQLGKDLMEVYAGSMIGGAEAYSLAEAWITGGKWNGPEMSALGHMEDIVNGIGGVFGAISDGDTEKAAKAVKNAALNIGMTFGVPAKNMETYLLAAVRWASPETAMEYDNLFGGIHKGDLKSMDGNVVGIGANLILRNRTGAAIDRSATDELSRLYGAGFTDAIPTNIPDSFSYGGKEVKVNRSRYSAAWGAVVGDNLEELLTNGDYQGADDKTKQAMIRKLYQYATVQARMDADPEYSAEGNSTYGWTLKADEAVDAGIELPSAIAALTTFSGLKADTQNGKTIVSKKAKVFAYIDGLDLDSEQKDLLFELAGYEKGLEDAPWHGGSGAETGSAGRSKRTVSTYEAEQAKAAKDPGYNAPGWTIWTDTAVRAGIKAEDAITHYNALAGMKADYDQYGKAITGSKKDKVCAYIDTLDLTDDQKDVLYLSVYKENSLKYTPWHGYTGGKSGGRKRRGRRGGGRRRRSAAVTGKPVQVGKLASGYDTGIDIRALFGGGSSGAGTGTDTSAGTELLEIINKHYGGNPLAAAMDGGRKARTKVDFKL